MASYEEEDDDGYFIIAGAYDDDDGFAIAASSEEEDDDYIKVISTFVPLPLALPSSSSHVCAAAIASSSSPAPYVDAEEEITFVPCSPPPASYCVDDDVHDAPAVRALWDQERQQDRVALYAAPVAQQQAPTTDFSLYCHDYEIADEAEDDDDEVTDEEEEEEDEDDYRYQGIYDLADRGRARHVKRSSGRRGRTKKKSAMGRPRGDVRVAHCSAVNL